MGSCTGHFGIDLQMYRHIAYLIETLRQNLPPNPWKPTIIKGGLENNIEELYKHLDKDSCIITSGNIK